MEEGSVGIREGLDALSKRLEGQRYGSLDCELEPGQGQLRDVWGALSGAMSS